jgi:hypothetical protein
VRVGSFWLEQNDRKPEEKERAHDDDGDEAHRAEGLAPTDALRTRRTQPTAKYVTTTKHGDRNLAGTHLTWRRIMNLTRVCALPFIVSVALSATAASLGAAQAVNVGDSIRLRSTEVVPFQWGRVEEPSWTESTVTRMSADSLWYRAGNEPGVISLAHVEVQQPTDRDRGTAGAVIGGLLFGTLGAALGYVAFEPSYAMEGRTCNWFGSGYTCSGRNRPVQQSSRAELVWGAASLGVLVGGLIGYAAGRSSGRWETVVIGRGAETGAVALNVRIPR